MKKNFISAMSGTVILIVIVANLFLISCSHEQDVVVPEVPTETGEVGSYIDSVYNANYRLYVIEDDTTAYPKMSGNTILTREERSIGRKLNNYALKMLVDYGLDKSKSMALSPMSASMLYSMMANFTNNEYEKYKYMSEMGLEYDMEKDLSSYHMKMSEITKENEGERDFETGFSVENDMLMDAGSTVYQSFLSTARAYNVDVMGVNFDDSKELSQYNDKIREKVGESSVGLNSLSTNKKQSLVSSAFSFKQLWKNRFSIDTQYTDFTDANGKIFKQKMLTRQDKEHFRFFNDFCMLELPYEGDKFSMLVALPDSNSTLSQALSELSERGFNHCSETTCDSTRSYHGVTFTKRIGKTGLLKYINGVFVDTVYVADTIVIDTLATDTLLKIRMPEFKYSGTIALNSSSNAANYTLYNTNLNKVSPNGFTLSNIYQSCCIEVTRDGTKATVEAGPTITPGWYYGGSSSGSGESGNYMKKPIIIGDEEYVTYVRFASRGEHTHKYIVEDFCVNRPFVVFIKENKTGTVLFSACIKTLDN